MKNLLNKKGAIYILTALLCLSLIVGSIVLFFCINVNDYVAIDENGNKYKEGTVYPMPQNISFKSDFTEVDGVREFVPKTITVEAIIKPDNATFKDLSYTLEWQFVGSTGDKAEWVKGKNVSDYVSVELNGTIFTITCLQYFFVWIDLKVTSLSNPDVSATCFLHCITVAVTNISFPPSAGTFDLR